MVENTVQEAVLEIAEDENENAEPEFESTLNCKTGGNWKLAHIAQLPSEMTGSLPFAQSFYKNIVFFLNIWFFLCSSGNCKFAVISSVTTKNE